MGCTCLVGVVSLSHTPQIDAAPLVCQCIGVYYLPRGGIFLERPFPLPLHQIFALERTCAWLELCSVCAKVGSFFACFDDDARRVVRFAPRSGKTIRRKAMQQAMIKIITQFLLCAKYFLALLLYVRQRFLTYTHQHTPYYLEEIRVRCCFLPFRLLEVGDSSDKTKERTNGTNQGKVVLDRGKLFHMARKGKQFSYIFSLSFSFSRKGLVALARSLEAYWRACGKIQ